MNIYVGAYLFDILISAVFLHIADGNIVPYAHPVLHKLLKYCGNAGAPFPFHRKLAGILLLKNDVTLIG